MTEEDYQQRLAALEVENDILRGKAQAALQWGAIAVYTYDVSSGQFDLSDSFFEEYEVNRITPFTLETFEQVCHPDDFAPYINGYNNLMIGATPSFNMSYRMRTVQGGWLWFEEHAGISHRDGNGTPTFITGTVQCITAIKQVEDELVRQDSLLSASNKAARMLLEESIDSEKLQVWRVLEILGKAAEVNRVYLWKNRKEEDGKLSCTQIQEWSCGVAPQQGKKETVDVSYDNTFSSWKTVLKTGNCINNIVRLMPQNEQDILRPQGIISILVAPIIYGNEFWGFLGFDDCCNERTDRKSVV
jgi:hypothetical protein